MTEGWLPPGAEELALQLGEWVRRASRVEPLDDALRWFALPERVVDEPTRPVEPTPWGDGALCVDLGPDDVELWERFRGVVEQDRDAESVASRAQVWRLPVTPFRRGRAKPTSATPNEHDRVDLRGVTVIDLTSMWAGPLCTELLARAGARVIKIEPAARPDGLRFGDGDSGSGDAPMFVELNGSKEILDIDLRHCSHRSDVAGLFREADLVVSSLSPRALENLGLTPTHMRERAPSACTLSITAFGAHCPEADWVAYGTGVHAASGLGWVDGAPRVPRFSYPDPLAGLAATGWALAQLAGGAPRDVRVSLEEAIRPLAAL